MLDCRFVAKRFAVNRLARSGGTAGGVGAGYRRAWRGLLETTTEVLLERSQPGGKQRELLPVNVEVGTPQRGASWWARMPDGGIRRVWATKAGGHYFCALEICSVEQEQARTRLFAGSTEPPDEARRRRDIEVWSDARFEQLRTADPESAFKFLGGDDIARNALLAADPELERIALGKITGA